MNEPDKNIKERASNLILANKDNGYKVVSASQDSPFNNKILDAHIDSKIGNTSAFSIAENKNLVAQHPDKERETLDFIQAKEKIEARNILNLRFVENIYQDLGTPLNGILGLTDLMNDPNFIHEKHKKYLKTIEKSGARLLKTIDNIVAMTKIHAGLIKINLHETNINKQIEKIYKFLKPEADSKGIHFDFKNSLPTEDAFFLTDCEKIYSILIHLVKNALNNTSKGSVEFGYGGTKSASCKTELMFFVKDTGHGIPKDQQEDIFENFTQSDISNKISLHGKGLGLSLTKAYVALLGGELWVESEEGKGAKFYFSLPYRIDLNDKYIH